MPKHKKTLSEKRKADARNMASTNTALSSPVYTFSGALPIHTNSSKQEQSIDTTTLVLHDVRKTAFISFSIVILQILFYFLLKNHVLAIPFVSY